MDKTAVSSNSGAGGPASASVPFPEFGVRRFGAVNWLGVWTLYKKEVWRFFKISLQTVFAPAATALLFLVIFTLALGRYRPDVNGISFGAFVAPGLVMMALLQNAFANSSSSLLVSKVQGNIVDILMPPLSAQELTIAFGMGAMTRGITCAVATAIPMAIFMDVPITHIWAIVYFAVGASLVLGLLGVIAGVWSEKFDHLASITNFVIVPLSLLSGTFYSITILPEPFHAISLWNPFFYFIDGFRYGFTGTADGSVGIGMAVVAVLAIGLWFIAHRMIASGYRLKA